MADPLRFVIVARGRRAIIKYIRGYLAELEDSLFSDAIGVEEPVGVQHLRGDGFQKPTAISAPIPAIGGERLVAWGGWQSMLTTAQRADIAAQAAARPLMVRFYEQNADETPSVFLARVKADCNWIDVARTV